MWQYELHPPHLINVATLPCESQNTENVILQRDITKENCIRCIVVDQGHHVPYIYLSGVLYSKAFTKQRFMTSTTCENAWYKLVLTLTGTSSMLAWPSEIMCACWWWTLWTHALTWNACSFMWFTRTFYGFTDVSLTATFSDRRFPDKSFSGQDLSRTRLFPDDHFPGQTFSGQVILRNFHLHNVCKYQFDSVNFVIIKWKMNATQTHTIMKEK